MQHIYIENMECINQSNDLLFENKKGYSYQCELTNTIVVNFDGIITSYKIKDFLIFQRMVNSVNVLDMLYNLSDEGDYKLIEATKRNFSKELTICEIVQLRDLLNGTKFILVLNSMVLEVLSDTVVY
ncbi:hypothetical protein [Flavobacterium frigidarium]|uniref:Uncharacterized protein n=1 Tax=Flavobacterium frigidarium TaxID=99286 RepID=A0ABV4KIQ2_9FLAO